MRWNTTRKATTSRCGRNTRPPRGRGPRPPHDRAAALGTVRGVVRSPIVRIQEPSVNPGKPNSGAGQPANILVVDDTPANLQVLAGMLKDRGYKVRPVPGGKLALLAARRDPPDLILLDINMPEMNGYEVCEHLKADEDLRGIPVIFISALTEPLDKVKAFATGGVDYLTKPFQMEELHARVETHLKLRRLQIELEETNARLAKANNRMSRDPQEAARRRRPPAAPPPR